MLEPFGFKLPSNCAELLVITVAEPVVAVGAMPPVVKVLSLP